MEQGVLQDWAANAGSPRVQVGLVLLRLAQAVRDRWGRRNPLSAAAALLYRLYSECFAGFEVPVATSIGPGFKINHGFGLVINSKAVIGRDVLVRHGVAIGATGPHGAAPVIGDGVSIGAKASVFGAVSVGAGADIGAHALVLGDVPAGGRVRAAADVARVKSRAAGES